MHSVTHSRKGEPLMSASPFDDLRDLVKNFPTPEAEASQRYLASLEDKAIINGSRSGMVQRAAWLAAWQGKDKPVAKDIHLCLLASSYSHGAAPEEVLAEVTRSSKGRAVVSPFCVRSGLGLRVLELGPQIPHEVNPANPNWTERDVMATVAFGMESTAAGGDILGLCGLAPGDDAPAKAIMNAVCGTSYSLPKNTDWVVAASDPLDALLKFGGREIAGMLGGLVASRSRRIPVLIEGWGALAAAAVLKALDPAGLDHIALASLTDSDQAEAAEKIGLSPVVGMETGAGYGVGLAMAADVMVSLMALADLPKDIHGA